MSRVVCSLVGHEALLLPRSWRWSIVFHFLHVLSCSVVAAPIGPSDCEVCDSRENISGNANTNMHKHIYKPTHTHAPYCYCYMRTAQLLIRMCERADVDICFRLRGTRTLETEIPRLQHQTFQVSSIREMKRIERIGRVDPPATMQHNDWLSWTRSQSPGATFKCGSDLLCIKL